ncbi:MAG: tripeptide aminopeptidase [Thermoleophilaceae bacterium]|jgi:tripeptide aminopeptidase|nr:tripeptide aminopeptidase [Thermoleophilaceae bacterium]
MARPASQDERAWMTGLFVRMCEVPSVSGNERAMADLVTAELRAMGLEVHEDDSGAETGSNAGNLLARIEGTGEGVILLCAHLDTVPQDAPIEVVEKDGFFVNRNQAILGADNKAAVAVILAVARRLVQEGSRIGVELLFTTAEELALRGAKAFDCSRLSCRFGFVFDHASPVGELIVAAPTYYRLQAQIRGKAVHAGIRPEEGRNAIAAAAAALARLELGRLDDQTTANVGTIEGGTASNVVAERCTVELEARSLDHERAGQVVQAMVDAFTAAAGEFECDLETVVEELFRGYRLTRTAEPVAVAAAALESCGIEPVYVPTGGGSDANALIPAGIPCLNIANGTERNHQPDERVSRYALEGMLDVALALVEGPA